MQDAIATREQLKMRLQLWEVDNFEKYYQSLSKQRDEEKIKIIQREELLRDYILITKDNVAEVSEEHTRLSKEVEHLRLVKKRASLQNERLCLESDKRGLETDAKRARMKLQTLAAWINFEASKTRLDPKNPTRFTELRKCCLRPRDQYGRRGGSASERGSVLNIGFHTV